MSWIRMPTSKPEGLIKPPPPPPPPPVRKSYRLAMEKDTLVIREQFTEKVIVTIALVDIIELVTGQLKSVGGT